jgi:hypothetical protein
MRPPTAAGGYFLTADVERPRYASAELLPARLLSLSACICSFTPDLWAVEWAKVSPDDRASEARKRGIEASQLPELIGWATQQINSGGLGWPCVFWSVADARRFADRFLRRADGLRLLGIGLPVSDVEHFLAEENPGPSVGIPGVYKAVGGRAALEPGGTELGWEVLCYDHGGFHSWLCNGLDTEAEARFRVRPNASGFITSADDARTVAEYCGREELGAEEGFWAPWLVVEYPLTR